MEHCMYLGCHLAVHPSREVMDALARGDMYRPFPHPALHLGTEHPLRHCHSLPPPSSCYSPQNQPLGADTSHIHLYIGKLRRVYEHLPLPRVPRLHDRRRAVVAGRPLCMEHHRD